ncbi:ECF transporter S component [Clostridium sp. DL1XJH146]
MKNYNLRKFILAALFIALSLVGAQIKIFNSIAFDSLPAFFGTLIIGPYYGALIGFLGHMFTAWTSGFPYTLPVHIITAFSMALTMVVFYFAHKKFGNVVACIIGVLFNGPIALLLSAPLLIPMMKVQGVIVLVPILSLVSFINIFLTLIIFRYIPEESIK